MATRHIAPIVLAIALAGCGSVGAINLPWKRDRAPSLDPAALPPVESSQLPPPVDGSADGTLEPLPQPGQDVASLNAPPATTGLGRTDLLGGWTITAGGDSCQLFMTLTSWTGGYRASTRGCSSDFLKSVSAWNLQGNQVILAGQGGTPIAHLQSAGTNRFDGTVDTQGAPVTFYR